jgi:DNA-binding IclR family transcriptional regulator
MVMSKIVERTLDFLELFAEQKRPLSLSDISRLLHIPVSSCHDVLQALQDRGYLYELAPRGGYYPTLRLQDMGQTIADNDPIVLRADIMLRAMRDTLDESVLLAKTNGLRATYLLAFQPTHPLRFLVNVGDDVRNLYATSAGKALLAHLDPKALAAFLKSTKLLPMTRNTITSKTALRTELEAGLARKWFLNKEETQEGVTTISATFTWNGAIYIVTIAGPTPRLEPRLAWAAEQLVEVCERLGMRPSKKPDAIRVPARG